MTYSEVTIKFTNDWVIGDRLKMFTYLNDLFYSGYAPTWVLLSANADQVTTGTPTSNPGETAAIEFKVSFDAKYPTGYITTVQNNNEVLIQSETQGELFVLLGAFPANVGTLEATFNNDNSDPTSNEDGFTAYVEKYYIHYCDDFNTDRDVYILKKGFIGTPTELIADENPISISYESSDDFKFSPIRPSVAEVFMIFDTGGTIDFEEFWTADERDFMVQDIKAGTIEWSGYVIPNGFQYEFIGGLYHASIQASDGLASLEGIPFVDDNQKPYGNQPLVYNDEFLFPFSLIITEILKKLGLDLDLWTCVDSYERSMAKTGDVREADPLSAAFVNVKTYIKEGENKDVPYWYGSGEEWNCKEVLENILYIFGAKLYQEWGVWRLKSINADIDYGTGATQRYWRKYNTVGTYLGDYDVIDDEIAIPCNDNTKFLLENDHVMSMDDVYSAFRMNYEYQFVRFGDTPVNLIPNGNFCDFPNTSILAAPTGWYRWRQNSSKWYIRLKDITIPFADAGGNVCGIEIGTQKTGIPIQQGQIKTDPNPAIWTALRTDNLQLTKGEDIVIEIWNRFRFVSPDGFVLYTPIYKAVLYGSNDKIYYLRNTYNNNDYKFLWEEIKDKTKANFNYVYDALFFFFDTAWAENYQVSELRTYKWYQFHLFTQPAPVSGTVDFAIHGLGATSGRDSSSFPAFKVWKSSSFGDSIGDFRVVRKDWIDEGGDIPRLQITGLQFNIIPNGSELPQQQDYIYENTNSNYTLQVDPITIYNGDVQNVNHISNITVPTNVSGQKNFWDDLSSSYGTSSLGLLTVREIMRQYQKPYRILEGNIKLQDARFGSLYTFDVLPDVRFILQRGTFNKQKQYIESATFVQISSDVLPDGGFEGGDTLEPSWQPTGNTYCKTVNFLNDGYVIIEEMDINPNSETYQQTREVTSTSQDLEQCPLSQPRLYYWGHDDIYLNVFTLVFSPFTQISIKEIQVSFNNIDNNYLYFVHLKSLGVVEKITTRTSPNNALSDWVYLSDVIIDGYIYRVLRTDYVMTEFTGFIHNFKFA